VSTNAPLTLASGSIDTTWQNIVKGWNFRLLNTSCPEMKTNSPKTRMIRVLYILVVGSFPVLLVTSFISSRFVVKASSISSRDLPEQHKTSIRIQDRREKMEAMSGRFDAVEPVPLTGGRHKESGLNATVTLVMPLKHDAYVTEILQWVESVEHLAQHVCILTETTEHSAWLHDALTVKMNSTLRPRVRLIDVSSEFIHCNSVDISSNICQRTPLSEGFSVGYKHMCRLWYSGIWPFLKDYDFILRIDIDNSYLHGEWPTHINFFGTVSCFLGQESPDVMVGLSEFFSETVSGANKDLEVLPPVSKKGYPYTNVMLVNVKWAINNADLLSIFQQVEDTKCICINRWGDLPLWGETLAKLGLRPEMMSGWRYRHGSHGNTVIVTDAASC